MNSATTKHRSHTKETPPPKTQEEGGEGMSLHNYLIQFLFYLYYFLCFIIIIYFLYSKKIDPFLKYSYCILYICLQHDTAIHIYKRQQLYFRKGQFFRMKGVFVHGCTQMGETIKNCIFLKNLKTSGRMGEVFHP